MHLQPRHPFCISATLSLFAATLLLLPALAGNAVAVQQPASQRQAADVCAQAFELEMTGKGDEAKQVLLAAWKTSSGNGTGSADVPYFLACIEARDGDPSEALRYLKIAKAAYGYAEPGNQLRQVLIAKRTADCLYEQSDFKEALAQYKSALAEANTNSSLPVIVKEELLQSIVACDMALKDWAEAEKTGLAVIELSHANSRQNVASLLNEVWSRLLLGDVYRLSGQKDKLVALKAKNMPFFEAIVDLRMTADSEGKLPKYDDMMDLYRDHYIDQLQAKTPVDVAWAAADFKEKTMPVVGWKSEAANPAAVILCIHGLGLENRAFGPAAHELNKRGYTVFAIDARGFGSFTQTKGFEDVDYDQTINDIRSVSQTIKQKYPGVPVYVLGESMGGAIALRAAAALGDQIDGVISSVPSAERFAQKKVSLQTALHLIVDPHKDRNLGFVTNQATNIEALRNKWTEDPKAKLSMTPIELTKFDIFMKGTKPQAEKISNLPVLIVQGLKDRLVKPEGTFALFNAVTSQDKTYLLQGMAEHLMFETPSPDPMLIDAVDSWLKTHGHAGQPSGTR